MADAPRPVEISGGKGIVVGDYAHVVQNFNDGSRPVTALIRTAEFRSTVEDRTRDFVGREFVFEGVQRVLDGPGSGYVMIRGEPGIGKTSIAATLVVRGSYVHHFNIAPANIRSPRQFLENTCAQLIVRYGLDYAALPPEAGEDGGFLSRLLEEAAAKERPVVVVVDALDEAEDVGLNPSANRLYLPRSLPEGVFFVVTSREESDYRLDVDTLSDIWIRDDDPANREDVRRYVEAFLERHGAPLDIADTVTELSEGNFMYLVHVLPEIAHGRGVGDLPRGLNGYYKRHWRDMKDSEPERFKRLQRPVLCFLAISREPVGVAQLAEWTQLEPGDVKAVISEWREFLNEDSKRYRIYHRSFADFLDEEENLRWYHDEIARTALAKIPGFL